MKEYEEQYNFFKSVGLIPTGFNSIWSNGNYKVSIRFFKDKIELTNLEVIKFVSSNENK